MVQGGKMNSHGNDLKEAKKTLVVGWARSEVPRTAGRRGKAEQVLTSDLGSSLNKPFLVKGGH